MREGGITKKVIGKRKEGGREGGTYRKKASRSPVSVGCFRVVPAKAIIMSLRYSLMVSIIIYRRAREGGKEGGREGGREGRMVRIMVSIII